MILSATPLQLTMVAAVTAIQPTQATGRQTKYVVTQATRRGMGRT